MFFFQGQYLCSNHFLSSDYFKSLQPILLKETPRKLRQLKPDAIPTLQIDNTVKQNTTSVSIDVISPIVGTSGNIKYFPEYITVSDAVGGSSKVAENRYNMPIL